MINENTYVPTYQYTPESFKTEIDRSCERGKYIYAICIWAHIGLNAKITDISVDRQAGRGEISPRSPEPLFNDYAKHNIDE